MRAALLLLVVSCAARGTADAHRDVEIRGNEGVATRELRAAARRELRSFADHRDGRLRLADAADAAYSMELLLREEGFAHGQVTWEFADGRLVFTVAEGPRTYLDEVRLTGVRAVPPEKLQTFFAFRRTGLLRTGPRRFRQAQVEAAAKEVESWYLLQGHFRVRVAAPHVEWHDEARTRAVVTVAVEEGPVYTVAAIEFDGMEPVDLGLVGKPYYRRLPAGAAARVRRRFLEEGLQFARVRGTANVDDAQATAVVRIVATPGPPVELGALRFDGHDRTNERFLRRRVPLRDGDLLRQQAIDRAIDTLYRAGLFSAVRPQLERTGDTTADLRIGLEELKARTLDLEVGYGSYELARGAVRYGDRNLFGLGRRLRAELRGSLKSYGIDLGLEDPWILGGRNTLELGTGYGLREEPSFDRETLHFDLIWRHDLSRGTRTRFGYRFRAEQATNVTGTIPAGEEAGFTRAAGLFAGIGRDTRDSKLLPTRGYDAELSVLWSAPAFGATLDFLELDLSGSHHLRVVPGDDRLVLATRVRFRTREILDSRDTLPIQERLFLGGESSVRSFRQDELGPFNAAGEPVGGLTAAEASLELRCRIWRQLHGAVFYDVGTVDGNAWSLTEPVGHAVGLGLRYYLPIGPARLDFGWNPGRRFAADQSWALHFAFGFGF